MFYRVTTPIYGWAVKWDSEGNHLASPSRIAELSAMGLPNTPPLIDHIDPASGVYVIYRDFDTQEQADHWVNFYSTRNELVSAPTVTEVEVKEVGEYNGAYLELTDEEKLTVWEQTFVTP
jgi:hypothetical protein